MLRHLVVEKVPESVDNRAATWMGGRAGGAMQEGLSTGWPWSSTAEARGGVESPPTGGTYRQGYQARASVGVHTVHTPTRDGDVQSILLRGYAENGRFVENSGDRVA